MNVEEAKNIYDALSRPPKTALRRIEAGKLKDKTDINPQWRYKAMTEQFGLVGVGWKYSIQNLWTEQGANGEKLAFAQVAVCIKDGDEWSEPIVGIGGSKLIQTEKGQLVSNDEGYKMAVTDAFSTSLKMLGVAADVYMGLWDGSKYTNVPDETNQDSNITRAKLKDILEYYEAELPPEAYEKSCQAMKENDGEKILAMLNWNMKFLASRGIKV